MNIFSSVLRGAPRLVCSTLCLFSAASAHGQCTPAWVPTFSAVSNGIGAPARAFATLGNGLYVGGQFYGVKLPGVIGDAKGLTESGFIAQWTGTEWAALGGNAAPLAAPGHQWEWSLPGQGKLNNAVLALTTLNGDLYVGGNFTSAVNNTGALPLNFIARWNGTQWSALTGPNGINGVNGTVWALTTFDDDGAGPHPAKLYAAGDFTTAGGTAAKYIACWNGTSWSSVGSGTDDGVRALTTFNGKLYAGGYFKKAGSTNVNYVASWNGSTWSKLGNGQTGTSAAVFALQEFDGSLYVGGMFAKAGNVNGTTCIARWNGSAWSPLASGVNNTVMSLTPFDDGSGAALFAGGFFTSASGTANTAHIAHWGGSAWSPLENGMLADSPLFTYADVVYALASFDDNLGDGPALFAGGWLEVAPTPAFPGSGDHYLAKWQGCPYP